MHQFSPKTPKKPQNYPYPAPERTYGADAQNLKPLDTSPALTTERVKIIERIIGKFLYCATRLDNTCLVPLITMSTKHYPTEQDEKYAHQFLDYMTTHPNSVVRFHASDMILRANTDESYLTEPEAQNCAAGFFS